MTKVRLWRVDVFHTAGFHAPCMMIETENDRLHDAEAQALKEAKINSRFAEMPNWQFRAVQLNKRILNGKWYSETEYNYKIEKLNKRKGTI